jgi:hypothetical protein
MRLTEFYALNEGRYTFYTLEPEANGMGRLLQWEEVTYAGSPEAEEAEDDVSYEVIEHGNIDRLLGRLTREKIGKHLPQVEDQLRQAWEQAVSDGGEAVWFGIQGGKPHVDIQMKASKDARDQGDDLTDYESDNPNRYF